MLFVKDIKTIKKLFKAEYTFHPGRLLVNTLSHTEPIISNNKGRKRELFKVE